MENEIVTDIKNNDRINLVKDAALSGAVTALAGIVVTAGAKYLAGKIAQKLEKSKNSIETTATES